MIICCIKLIALFNKHFNSLFTCELSCYSCTVKDGIESIVLDQITEYYFVHRQHSYRARI